MPRGITSDVPQQEGRSNFIRHVRLRDDGEFCRLWFLTEGDEMFFERFHNVKSGEERGPRWFTKICVNAAFGQACEYCEQAEDNPRGPVGSARTEFLAWTYELMHFYREKPTRIEVKKASVGSGTVYVAEVNEPRLLRASIMHRGPIKTRMERHGTVTDRPFDWIREGEKGSNRPTYTLEALDKEKMPKELKELMSSLPDLEDIALGKVERLDGGGSDDDDSDKQPSKRYATRTVKLEDDDDEEEIGNEFVKSAVKTREKPEPEDEGDDDEDPFGP